MSTVYCMVLHHACINSSMCSISLTVHQVQHISDSHRSVQCTSNLTAMPSKFGCSAAASRQCGVVDASVAHGGADCIGSFFDHTLQQQDPHSTACQTWGSDRFGRHVCRMQTDGTDMFGWLKFAAADAMYDDLHKVHMMIPNMSGAAGGNCDCMACSWWVLWGWSCGWRAVVKMWTSLHTWKMWTPWATSGPPLPCILALLIYTASGDVHRNC